MTGLYHFGGHMADAQLGSELDKIKSSLEIYSEPTITGARLWSLIRDAAPDLNIREVVGMPTGPGALSRFVDRHLKDVLESGGKSGSDPIYSIINVNSSQSGKDTPETRFGLLWKTFVRSGSSKTVVLTEKHPFIDVVELDSLHDSAKEVKSATREELDKIRIDFTKILSEKFGEKEKSVPSALAPFADWSNSVRKLGAQNYKDWAVFRIGRIIELFVFRLKDLHVEEVRQQELARLMRRSQSMLREASVSQNSLLRAVDSQAPVRSLEPNSDIVKPLTEDQLRSAVAAAVMSLPLSDLRELRLPVGIIFDIFNNNLKNN